MSLYFACSLILSDRQTLPISQNLSHTNQQMVCVSISHALSPSLTVFFSQNHSLFWPTSLTPFPMLSLVLSDRQQTGQPFLPSLNLHLIYLLWSPPEIAKKRERRVEGEFPVLQLLFILCYFGLTGRSFEKCLKFRVISISLIEGGLFISEMIQWNLMRNSE